VERGKGGEPRPEAKPEVVVPLEPDLRHPLGRDPAFEKERKKKKRKKRKKGGEREKRGEAQVETNLRLRVGEQPDQVPRHYVRLAKEKKKRIKRGEGKSRGCLPALID